MLLKLLLIVHNELLESCWFLPGEIKSLRFLLFQFQSRRARVVEKKCILALSTEELLAEEVLAI